MYESKQWIWRYRAKKLVKFFPLNIKSFLVFHIAQNSAYIPIWICFAIFASTPLSHVSNNVVSGWFDDLWDWQGPFATVLRGLREHKEHHRQLRAQGFRQVRVAREHKTLCFGGLCGWSQHRRTRPARMLEGSSYACGMNRVSTFLKVAMDLLL